MCAATPTLMAFLESRWGPLVKARHCGLEHRKPTRAAIVSLVRTGKSSRMRHSYYRTHLFSCNKALGSSTESRRHVRLVAWASSLSAPYVFASPSTATATNRFDWTSLNCTT